MTTPRIEETHNTREVEEVINEFKEKRKSLFTRGGLSVLLDYEPHDIVLDEKSVIEWLRTTLHHQLQKAREEERERIASELDELMEQLADIEHNRWSKWQRYLHSKVIPSADDGISLIGTEFIDRWNRQIATPYSELSEAEKESDREQVRPYLELIKRKIRNHSELEQDNK